MADAYLINRGNIDAPGRLPAFKYTGDCYISDGGKNGETRNWSVNFRSSGLFTSLKDMEVNVSTAANNVPSNEFKKGKISLTAGTTYSVVSGRNGSCSFGNLFSAYYRTSGGFAATCYISISNLG